jgi:hypothetical protein
MTTLAAVRNALLGSNEAAIGLIGEKKHRIML